MCVRDVKSEEWRCAKSTFLLEPPEQNGFGQAPGALKVQPAQK